MRIQLTSIPHRAQRYPTCGDWIVAHGHLRHIRVSDTGNEDYSFLVAIHELIEAWLCLKRGIKQEAVDAFDMAYERDRDPGDESEPGDSGLAPYWREHRFAENIERQIAHELGVHWATYEAALQALE